LETNFAAYKDKHALQVELSQNLLVKEEEVERLSARVAELEGQLPKLSIPDEEERKEDPKGEFTSLSRGALIRELIDAQNSVIDMATSSFQNAVAQVQALNPGVELILEGLDECKEVRDGVVCSPLPAPTADPDV
jgi:hypothetical protein